MKNKTGIYCKTTAKGQLTFYLSSGNKNYFLFSQNYRKSTRMHFRGRQPIARALSTFGVHSAATLKTIERLRSAIRYVEREYGISILKRTLKKEDRTKSPYKRQKFIIEYENIIA